MTGHELIAAERIRQVSEEGYDAGHDKQHTAGELIDAATAYIYDTLGYGYAHDYWPFEDAHYKPGTKIGNLVKAGALIAAEIDRLQSEGVTA